LLVLLILNQVEKLSPCLLLVAAHLSILLDDASRAGSIKATLSERYRRYLVKSVVFATVGANHLKSERLGDDDMIEIYAIANVSHTPLRPANNQEILFSEKAPFKPSAGGELSVVGGSGSSSRMYDDGAILIEITNPFGTLYITTCKNSFAIPSNTETLNGF